MCLVWVNNELPRCKTIILLLIIQSFFVNALSAQHEADSIRNILRSAHSSADSAKAFIALSTHHLGSNFNASLASSDTAIEIAKRIENDSLLLRAYSYNSTANIYLGSYDQAKKILKESISLAKVIGDRKTELGALNRIGVAFLNQSFYDSADLYFSKTIAVSIASKDSTFLSGAFLNIGLIHNYKGNLPEAADYYIKSLEIAELLDDKKSAAYARNNFGYLHFEQEKYKRALEVYDQCIADGVALNDLMLLSDCYYMKAKIHDRQSDFDLAIGLFRQAIEIDSQQNNTRGLATKFGALGQVFMHKNEFEEAQNAFKKAIGYAQSFEQNGQILPECFLNLGMLSYQQGNYKRAEKQLLDALETAEQNQLLDIIVEARLALSKTYAAVNDHERAYQNHVIYTTLRDSLINDKKHEHINELEAKYQVAKKELVITKLDAENQLNSSKNRQIVQLLIGALIVVILLLWLVFMQYRVNKTAKRNAIEKEERKQLVEEKSKELERVLGMKETLLKEIHHRVKNNLQVISSLISLQAATLKDKKAKASLIESQNRIKTIALIHQKLYQTGDLSRIDFHSYTSQLAHIIASLYKHKSPKIELEVAADDVVLEIDLAVPLGLIINELLTNALKYGFLGKAEGKIALKIRQQEGEIILTVKDNGLGFPLDFDPQKSSSLGLKLVHLLAKQLKGKVHFHNEKGLLVTVIIPSGFKK